MTYSPPVRDIDTVRALNTATRNDFARTPRYGARTRYGDRLVVCGRPNLPYGQSVHAHGRLTHVPTAVYLAWRRGVVVGQMARWWCGRTSRTFALSNHPVFPLCHLCAMQGARGAVVVVVNVG